MSENLENFKGLYYENTQEKYLSPRTGAHFNYWDICTKL